MIEYSNDALQARPQFFAPFNDLTIIAEDMAGESLYTQILRRLIGDNISICTVLGVGGKSQVLRRFQDRRGVSSNPTEFYIIDGDIDELIAVSCPESKYLYRLKRYDIESFLIEEGSICTIAEEECPGKTYEQHRIDLNIGEWQRQVVNLWSRIVPYSAAVQQLTNRSSSLDLSVESVRSGSEVLPDETRIDAEIQRAIQSSSEIDEFLLKAKVAEVTIKMDASYCGQIRWVSGKNVLVPLLIRLLRQQTGRNFRSESLCFRLAKHCHFQALHELRERIFKIAAVDAS